MPELPDLTIYIEALRARVSGQRLLRFEPRNAFLVRTVEPPPSACEGRAVVAVERLGKRIVFGFEDDYFAVLHLMIAGRLAWKSIETKVARNRVTLAVFAFESGQLVLTEAGSKRRASLHFVRGREALATHDPSGLEMLTAELPAFRARILERSHTLKRALTDPSVLSGIGNAYSDEILHRARLSPVKRTSSLADDEVERLFHATRDVLAEWIERLRSNCGAGFPTKVTAFRAEMAVHGKYREPCPACAAPIQRIVHADNETNYCATCQTQGVLLKDRALSQLLHDDWPRTIEEWEALRGQ
ncbi:MAG: DNA-formamidopyrimidine glycosylase family protein [Planctomycetota bacterium]